MLMLQLLFREHVKRVVLPRLLGCWGAGMLRYSLKLQKICASYSTYHSVVSRRFGIPLGVFFAILGGSQKSQSLKPKA